ncbi:thiamine/thiamine pyrophosphate ABC transporter permease [Mesorhizobium sp. Z1-4]|uniref:thiamine/thiamine pyrophosphate ABC transporter permease n=1 Tax=Mesorhizobium sp. Z1-4 TaxID=2448478 RepID=UPI000FD81852|nr:thiamine/thiamine pyrophosphate ABC transporter permease [Mesorhizobium sp. Z1-4]
MPAAAPIRGRILPGALALGAIGLVMGGAAAGLIWEAGSDWSGAASALDGYLMRVVRFTLWQALLSTVLSVLPGIFVARALARLPAFPGRGAIVWLFGVPLALPAIVAALGVLALLGRAGIFADVLSTLTGDDWPGIYGLSGILVAHVFFNMPLAARMFLEAFNAIPADHRRLEAQLGMSSWSAWRLVEWPAVRVALPGVAMLVFMLCITSFTIVLLLGGGPAATTLEVAIYQALRFDFDPGRAVTLTFVQLVLTGVVVAVAARLGAQIAGEAFLSVSGRTGLFTSGTEKLVNAVILAAGFLFVAGPMAAIVLAGLDADLMRLLGEASVRDAAVTSLVLALLAASLSVALSVSLVMARRALELRRGRLRSPGILERMTDQGAALVLVIPPIVIGAGWFVLLRQSGAGVFAAAPVMVVTVNAIMAMPFAMRAIRPAYDSASARHERLCAQLGISGLARLRLIDWPPLRRPLATAFAFAMALSLGDLGVIALFGSEYVKTLPYLLLERLSAYRTQDAAGVALMLGTLCFALMMFADWASRRTR